MRLRGEWKPRSIPKAVAAAALPPVCPGQSGEIHAAAEAAAGSEDGAHR